MTWNNFQGSPVIVNTSNTLSGVGDAVYNPGIDLVKPFTDGRPVKTLITIGKQAPTISIQTINIAQALNLMAAASSTESLPWLALTNLKAYARLEDPNSPKFSAGSVHELITATAGTMFFAGLEATSNEPAVMSVMCLLTSSDGTTHPCTFTQVAAPSDPNTIAPYFLSTVTIDGTTLDEVESVSIQPNVQVQSEFGMLPYTRFARPRTVDWSISVRHKNVVLERSKTDKSAAIAVTLKNANNGGPTRGTTVVTFTVTGTLIQGGSNRPGEGDAMVTHTVWGRHDGTNQPASWSVV